MLIFFKTTFCSIQKSFELKASKIISEFFSIYPPFKQQQNNDEKKKK